MVSLQSTPSARAMRSTVEKEGFPSGDNALSPNPPKEGVGLAS